MRNRLLLIISLSLLLLFTTNQSFANSWWDKSRGNNWSESEAEPESDSAPRRQSEEAFETDSAEEEPAPKRVRRNPSLDEVAEEEGAQVDADTRSDYEKEVARRKAAAKKARAALKRSTLEEELNQAANEADAGIKELAPVKEEAAPRKAFNDATQSNPNESLTGTNTAAPAGEPVVESAAAAPTAPVAPVEPPIAGVEPLLAPATATDKPATEVAEPAVKPVRKPSRRLASEESTGSDPLAEEERPVKKKKKRKKARRSVASIESSESIEEDSDSSGRIKTRTKRRRGSDHPDDFFRINLATGVASVEGSGGSLLNVGLQADFQRTYFGLDLDAYYGLGLGSGGSSTGSSTTAASGSYSQYGGFLTAKGQYPIRLGKVSRIIPKLGAGYGMISMTTPVAITSGSTTSTGNATASLSGVYAMAGIDVVLTKWFYLTFDYAKSLTASGKAEVTLATGSSSADLTDAQFQRMRIGANFLIGDHFLVGGQYYSRTIVSQGDSSPQTFILGNLGVQW